MFWIRQWRSARRGELERAAAAADWLIGLACERSMVVVTHGVFRRVLAARLSAMGWRADAGQRGYGHWSAWALAAPPVGATKAASRVKAADAARWLP